MATVPSSSLLDALRQHRLLEPAQLTELEHLLARFPETKALARELMNRGWLTAYQVNQLLQGKPQELVLGQYILLERLGEGGMGQVFKARHRNLHRIVAVKLIRKERLDNPAVIKRFQREVRAAAALDHPNIVRALDADQLGGTHLLVMEYIEGATDLSRLVKLNGPLPVTQACAYIRQAALGLQHAFERGMVHRDIKPANLLLTADGKTVKLLDMGLARLDHSAAGDEASSTMTQEGMVMGTPDYLPPEQAQESHTVDIRADLYSLGCTLYYLLSGRVPFPGGTVIDKLCKHRLEEPKPVEQLRAGLPPTVTRIVRKLMAKRPEDRYQTPAELAGVLAGPFNADTQDSQSVVATGKVLVESPTSINSVFADLSTSDRTEALVATPQPTVQKASRPRWLLPGVVGGCLLLPVMAFVSFLALRQFGVSRPEKRDADILPVRSTTKKHRPKADESWFKQVAAMPAEAQVQAVAAKLKELNPGFDGVITHKTENSVVTELTLATDAVTNIAPLRALSALRRLNCAASAPGKGKLSDISPLKGMALMSLTCSNTMVSDLSPLKNMKLTALNCSFTQVSDLSPLSGMPLTSLWFPRTRVSDLSPLKDTKLTELLFDGAPVSDLSPIQDLRLNQLSCAATRVVDLAPIKRMPLTELSCGFNAVSDISPLRGMKLANVSIRSSEVTDLSPLKDTALLNLDCVGAPVSDLSPLRDLPLTEIVCDFSPDRDSELLRSIKTLKKINNKPAATFWRESAQEQMAFQTWLSEVSALPAEKQVAAVAAKLKERNKQFDGKVTPKIDGNVVTELTLVTDAITDISPIKALLGLDSLNCSGTIATIDSRSGNGILSDLSPLGNMKITRLACNGTKVSNLAPLKTLKLTSFACGCTRVSDLSPLKSMPLTQLLCPRCRVADLSPLRGMKLTVLWLDCAPVADLSPIEGMPITSLLCAVTNVSDLSPLKGMPLTSLSCGWTKVTDLSPLKGMRLTDLRIGNLQVTDLSVLRGMPLTTLDYARTPVADISPLKDMPLKEVYCDFRADRDTQVLRAIKTLEKINGRSAIEFWKIVGQP